MTTVKYKISEGSVPSLSDSHAYALLMGGASLEVIMDQFKHSSMKTTMSYIDSIDNEKRKDIAKLL
jgi:site-specific recombinase XerD